MSQESLHSCSHYFCKWSQVVCLKSKQHLYVPTQVLFGAFANYSSFPLVSSILLINLCSVFSFFFVLLLLALPLRWRFVALSCSDLVASSSFKYLSAEFSCTELEFNVISDFSGRQKSRRYSKVVPIVM